MKFCIVSPATVSEFGPDLAESEAILRLAEHAPVGVLTLAAVLEQGGRPIDIVDMNQLYYAYLHRHGANSSTDFCTYCVEQLSALDCDVIGLGTICSSYPLTLRVAEGLKASRPELLIVLGGPQASVVDEATMHAFPAVDFILRFEAEESLPLLLGVLEDGGPVSDVPGLTFRNGAEVLRTPNAPPLADLDALPLPAYHRYPPLAQARYIPLELGRGCPYGCTFCSTNDFFRRKFRLKSPKLIVEQMTRLKAAYGVGVFDLIHDMFTVDRGKVVEFCQEILDSGQEFFWNCSARTDRVDDELLALMSRAGCRGIFYGIETGSDTLQKEIKKRLVLSEAMARVRTASDQGMTVAVSLITGFPTEQEEDFRDTAAFFVEALRAERAQPQLHILAPLADTPLHRQFRDKLTFDDIMSDMSHQGWSQDPEDRALISQHPDIFPSFYAIPTPLDREFLKEMRSFLLYGAEWMRWLLVAVHGDVGHIVDVFLDFQAWRADRSSRNDDPAQTDRVGYFNTVDFREDFVQYVRESIAPRSDVGGALSALAAYTQSFDNVVVDDPTRDVPALSESGRLVRTMFGLDSVPRLADNVRVVDVEVDFSALMKSLAQGGSLRSVDVVPHTLASRKLPGRWPEVLQLSPASLSLLRMCDGQRSVRQIAERFSRPVTDASSVPGDKYCLVGLELLRHDGLVDDARVEITRGAAPAGGREVAGSAQPALAWPGG